MKSVHKRSQVNGHLAGMHIVKLCQLSRIPAWDARLTRDSSKVTCKQCLKILNEREK